MQEKSLRYTLEMAKAQKVDLPKSVMSLFKRMQEHWACGTITSC